MTLDLARQNWKTLSAKRQDITADLLRPTTRDAAYLGALDDLEENHLWSAGSENLPTWAQRAVDGLIHDQRWYQIPEQDSVSIADFPVTNLEFEAFCPAHRRWRDQYSAQDDQPAIYVSWYMATQFAKWLSAVDPRYSYRLPTENAWEAACRWRTNADWDYWWGKEMNDDLCWYGAFFGNGPAKVDKRARSHSEAIEAYKSARQWHPSRDEEPQVPRSGLVDMLGNVGEWCADWYDYSESVRVVRGGSWDHFAVGCCSACRYFSSPDHRLYFIGFRLVRV